MNAIDEVGKRYAEALLDAESADGIKIEAQLAAILTAFDQDDKLRNLFETPRINKEKKKELFNKSFSGKVEPILLSFLCLLIDKGREEALSGIFDAIIMENNKRLGRVRAEVYVASSNHVDDELKEELKTLIQANKARFGIESKADLNIELSLVEKPEVIGGIELKIDDYIWDASVSSYLNNWKRKSEEHKVIAENAWS